MSLPISAFPIGSSFLKNDRLLAKHGFVMPVPIALYYFLRIVFLLHSQKFGELRVAR